MQFEIALNAAWIGLSVFALASTLRTRLRTSRSVHLAPVWLHVCGVALILAALFPYISATDDILRIEHMDMQQKHDHGQPSNRKTTNDGLMRLYEAMDTPLVSAVRPVTFSTFFVGLVVIPAIAMASTYSPAASGRSPPFAADSLSWKTV